MRWVSGLRVKYARKMNGALDKASIGIIFHDTGVRLCGSGIIARNALCAPKLILGKG